MFRARRLALSGIFLMLAAASTEARQLDFSVDNRIGWDSNVFLQESDGKSDGFWEFSPRAVLSDSRDTLEYDFSYRPTFQAFFETEDIDGWDHYGKADVEMRPTPADTISFGGSVVSSRIVRQFLDTPSVISPSDPNALIQVESDRDRTVRSLARIGYRRSLSPSTSAEINFNFEDLDFSDDQNVDIRSYSVSATSTRVLGPLTRAGLSATGRFRNSRGLDTVPTLGQFSSHTLTGDFTLFFARAITPSIQFSAQAGPSITRTEQNAPPLLDADQSTPSRDRTSTEDDVSFVADIRLNKTWRHATGSIGYTRFESGTGGSSSASTVDQVSMSINHRPTRKWDLSLNLSWNQRKVISGTVSNSNSRFQRYSVSASAEYAISRHLSVVGRGAYRRFGDQDRRAVIVTNPPNPPMLVQETKTDLTESFVGTISIRYSFDPIIF